MADKAKYCIGLMSGTSVDSIDAAVVDFRETQPRIVATHEHPIPDAVRSQTLSLFEPGDNEIDRLGSLDRTLGHCFADAANALISNSGIPASKIIAIGSHGQTIRHRPKKTDETSQPFSLQIGDPNTIASKTGITTVADFRRRDIAEGGQGAPLAPGFHNARFQSNSTNRCIVNIGGLSNITLLPKDHAIAATGFDTGPGNCLMDAWIGRHCNKKYDRDGEWARSGSVNTRLLNHLLKHPYFFATPPKSTGREEFNLTWLTQCLTDIELDIAANDVQATLAELTTRTISDSIISNSCKADEIYICGGGAYNSHIMSTLRNTFSSQTVASTMALGLPPEWVEATAFAWLALQRMELLSGNLPSVTGAKQSSTLGAIYCAN